MYIFWIDIPVAMVFFMIFILQLIIMLKIWMLVRP